MSSEEGVVDYYDVEVGMSTQDDTATSTAIVVAENDLFLGADSTPRQINTQPRTVMEWCEGLAVIDNGAWMKTKTGTSGQSPSEDSFPWFSSSSTMQHVHLLWDLSPSEWRLVSFQNRPRDPYDPDEYLNAKLIMLTDITEILLEVAPSPSFRIYLGETKQVVKLTPCPHDRDVAARWVDAIFAAMYLQNVEEEAVNNANNTDNTTVNAANNPTDATPESKQDTTEDIDEEDDDEVIDWFELRDNYYQLHPEERPIIPNKEDYEKVVQEVEQNNRKSTTRNKSTDTTEATNANNHNSSRRQSKRLSISSMLDYNTIYNNEDNAAQDEAKLAEQNEHACCIIA